MRSTRAQAIKQIQALTASATSPSSSKVAAAIPSKPSAATKKKSSTKSKHFAPASPSALSASSSSELSSALSEIESSYSEDGAGDSSSQFSQDFESDASAQPTTTPRKRKRGGDTGGSSRKVKVESTSSTPKPKSIGVNKPKVKRENGQPITISYEPPANWREQYDAIKEMRLRIPAAVDTVGCERLAQLESDVITPKINRFQTLIALMLSSQTKDTVTGATVMALQRDLPGGLTVESILAVDPVELDRRIGSVGFHNRKTEYIKKTAVILRDKFDGDVPRTIEDMISLPGVGPKMAHLLSSAAWNDTQGIGVDTHVHRLCQLYKWVPPTQSPEHTRLILESWLPRDLWREINWLLVGFGQTVCLPRGRRCWECTMGPKKTGGSGMCKAALHVTGGTPRKIKSEVKVEVKAEDEEENEGVEMKGKVKVEEIEQEIKVEDPIGIEGHGEIIIKEELKKKTALQDDEEEHAVPDIEDLAGRVKSRTRRKVIVKKEK